MTSSPGQAGFYTFVYGAPNLHVLSDSTRGELLCSELTEKELNHVTYQSTVYRPSWPPGLLAS